LKCQIAGNGKEAYELVKSRPSGCEYKIIFMDYHMPIMNGFEAT
jgi:CheY-like chemotaxis protein